MPPTINAVESVFLSKIWSKYKPKLMLSINIFPLLPPFLYYIRAILFFSLFDISPQKKDRYLSGNSLFLFGVFYTFNINFRSLFSFLNIQQYKQYTGPRINPKSQPITGIIMPITPQITTKPIVLNINATIVAKNPP